MAATTFSHSAHYSYLDEALRAQWPSHQSLVADMDSFIPKPKEDFAEARKAELERLQALNPTTPVEQLAVFVDQQFAFLSSDWWQFHNLFDKRHISTYITVVMLSHALCEALINAILAIGLAHSGSPELFTILERADFKQKWVVGPQAFAPKYRFPTGSALHETLNQLARVRNAIVHLKIDLEYGGTKVLEGSAFERKPYSEENKWLRRFFSLPYDLAEFTRKAVVEPPLMLLIGREPIEVAPEHLT